MGVWECGSKQSIILPYPYPHTISMTVRLAHPFNLHLHARAELRRALFAAAETCWVYAILLTVGALLGPPRLIAPLWIFLVYWAGLEIGYYLPRVRRNWRLLQWTTLGLGALLILVVLRAGLDLGVPLLSLSWLSIYLNQLLTVSQGLSGAQIATVVLLYAYVRGVGFGQRPLTLWFVGFQFRLGVLILFFNGLLGVVTRSVDWRAPLMAYFIISLLGISLARIEEGGREMPLGWTWALILVGASVLVVAFGFFITPLFTVATANALFALLTPLAPVFEFLLNLILVPLIFIIQLIFTLLGPLLRALAEALRSFQQALGAQAQAPPSPTPSPGPDLTFLLPYGHLLLWLAAIFVIGFIVMRALHRRLNQLEEETFQREEAGERELSAAQKIKRPRATSVSRHEIEAENVRRIYAALLAQAAEVGTPRREAETPFEFLPRLGARFPEAEPDLKTLTDAYVAVHYAQIPATSSQVQALRAVWRRVRGLLVKET